MTKTKERTICQVTLRDPIEDPTGKPRKFFEFIVKDTTFNVDKGIYFIDTEFDSYQFPLTNVAGLRYRSE